MLNGKAHRFISISDPTMFIRETNPDERLPILSDVLVSVNEQVPDPPGLSLRIEFFGLEHEHKEVIGEPAFDSFDVFGLVGWGEVGTAGLGKGANV
jgi:hypothetical protein